MNQATNRAMNRVMSWFGRAGLAFALAAVCAAAAFAQPSLGPGGLVFTGYDASGSDSFSFVLLEDVGAGTTIRFTERGWLAEGGFRSGEATFDLVFDRSYACGSEFVARFDPLEVRDAAGERAGEVSGRSLALSTSGDQVFAFQGAEPTAEDPSGLIAGLQMNGGWDADATSANSSALPPGLAAALAIEPEVNNARYDCSVVAAEPAALRLAALDPSRWQVDDGSPFDLSAFCGFACAAACAPPEVPTLAGDASIVAGESAELRVASGSLGDATEWRWYEGSCGGAPAGSGAAISVSPVETTAYFARGEGGCVQAGPCASITVAVESAPPPTRAQRKCLQLRVQALGASAAVAGADALSCVKDYAKGKVASAEACVTADRSGRVGAARDRAARKESKRCTEEPAFGPASAPLAADEGVAAMRGLLAGLVGGSLDAGLAVEAEDRALARCQRHVALASRACALARLGEFFRCAKAGLADGSIASAADLAGCLAGAGGGRAAKVCDRGEAGERGSDPIRRELRKRCSDAEVDLAAAFSCPAASGLEEAHACLLTRISCRVCEAIRRADGLAVDCDALDDGSANGSCRA